MQDMFADQEEDNSSKDMFDSDKDDEAEIVEVKNSNLEAEQQEVKRQRHRESIKRRNMNKMPGMYRYQSVL
jgi:hypothetical protein